MKKILYILILAQIINGCASLSKTQIESVNNFATTTKEFSTFPSKILEELSEIRLKRGLMLATTFTNPQLRKNEIDSIYHHYKSDNLASEKVDVAFKIIDKYAQSLKLLSSEEHSANLDEQVKKFGIGIDSLSTLYNSIEGSNQLQTGLGNAVGKLILLGGKQYVKVKQAEEIKKFVTSADSLIEIMTDNILEFLQSSFINDFIRHENSAIELNYLSYLRKPNPDDEYQKIYIELKNSIEGVKKLNEQAIKATNELRKSHKKLTEIISEKRKLSYLIKEIQSLYEQVKEMKKTISEIEKTKNN